jgi:hypothetical protein
LEFLVLVGGQIPEPNEAREAPEERYPHEREHPAPHPLRDPLGYHGRPGILGEEGVCLAQVTELPNLGVALFGLARSELAQ